MDLSSKHPQTIREKKKKEVIEDKVSSSLAPSSSTASPSHEFSFTISLQSTRLPPTPSSQLAVTNSCTDIASTSSVSKLQEGSKTVAISPPRNSNSSAENFTLPLDRIESDLNQRSYNTTNGSFRSETTRTRIKSVLDIFRIWRAKTEETDLIRNGNKTRTGKKRLELGQVLKRFVSMVENIFSMNNRRERDRRDLQKRPHSFSVPREREHWRRKKGQRSAQRSAPASMRGSPSHSGHFSMSSINKLSSSSDESTMEELQNAIEAAIAHCKSSIAVKQV